MIRRVLTSSSIRWSLLDQGLVSGFNFAIGVLLARQLGLGTFGSYVIAQTYMQYAGGIQGALVVIPMMSAVPLERDPAAQHTMLRGFFAYAIVVLLLTSAGVTFVAWLVGQWSPALALGPGTAIWPLWAAMLSTFLQDWPRRALFARSANRAVFLSDLVVYGGQWCVLAFLASRGALTFGAALWVLAGSFAISAVMTIAAVKVSPDFRAVSTVLRTHGRSGRDYLVSGQLQWLGASGVVMVGTGFIGSQAAGAIRASQNLLGPFNVLFQWMENVLPVRSALHLREGGREQLALLPKPSQLDWFYRDWAVRCALGAHRRMADGDHLWCSLPSVCGAGRSSGALLPVRTPIPDADLLQPVSRRAGDVARSSVWWQSSPCLPPR